ncbi:DUF6053 domain-containing protein [Lysobacter sp. CA199]|uniref:DUF6053 domain-containing protein n=1 Tax=Lysobacter sp. CA199 TaxID=3455608 RepID=UPI003F8D525E
MFFERIAASGTQSVGAQAPPTKNLAYPVRPGSRPRSLIASRKTRGRAAPRPPTP